MKFRGDSQTLLFENVWKKDVSRISAQVLAIWQKQGGPVGKSGEERLKELVFVVKNDAGEIVGISTAFKVYVRQLRNHFFFFRLLIMPEYRIPGLMSRLLVSTRDFLESIHESELEDPPIGLFTLVENEKVKRFRNEAVWPASGMVYIGNSSEGHHIRVYYFKGARISP